MVLYNDFFEDGNPMSQEKNLVLEKSLRNKLLK